MQQPLITLPTIPPKKKVRLGIKDKLRRIPLGRRDSRRSVANFRRSRVLARLAVPSLRSAGPARPRGDSGSWLGPCYLLRLRRKFCAHLYCLFLLFIFFIILFYLLLYVLCFALFLLRFCSDYAFVIVSRSR